ncbi:MAG: hypothetical protein H6712_24730 [Myxococcales bacterium]|nr:hypothetical protein [Myxococcales bacterium]MCB9717085.1 hypothetical protein [Myxococcales bacterium]
MIATAEAPRRAPRSPGLGLLLGLCACHPDGSASPRAAAIDDPFAAMPYASAPLPATAKVFLVAGGDDVANFAADVIDQHALWKRAGLRDDEIACYYAKPSEDALREDGEQLGELAPALRRCYSADPATLHAHLREAAGRAPPFLYLFVSGHGLPPLLRWHTGLEHEADLPSHMELRRGEVGLFDRHSIGLEGGDAPALGEVDEILAAYREGVPVESLVLTPDTLARALAPLPPSSELVVVLQACFSGGFIGRPDDDGPSPLVQRPHTTVLTASSPGRPSFGCSPGTRHTYYGGALNRVLDELIEQQPRLPPALPWAEIHERVRFVVETMEDIEGERPSSPQLFDGHAKPE